MNMTFLGHNGWLIEHDRTRLLIDPILCDGNGFGPDGGRIYPPCLLTLDQMPEPTHLLITHEHTDHFHLPTLLALPKTIPVFVGPLMPRFILTILENLGYESISQRFTSEPFEIDDLKLRLYNAASLTVFWEKRVNQCLIHPTSQPDQAVFFAVDAEISPYFRHDLEAGLIPKPAAIAASNNSDFRPAALLGSLDDCRISKTLLQRRMVRLQVIRQLLVTYLDGLDIRNILVVGGGLVKHNYIPGPDALNQGNIAELAARLSDYTCVGPLPGDCFSFSNGNLRKDRVTWIKALESVQRNLELLRDHLDVNCTEELRCVTGESQLNADRLQECLRIIETELTYLARAFMLSKQGQAALNSDSSSEPRCDPRIFIISLVTHNDHTRHQFALDVTKAEFLQDSTEPSQLCATFPCGLIMHIVDLVAIFNGRLQIWDVTNGGTRSWYSGDDPFMSPIAFLYTYLGEQVRPQLAASALSIAVERLGRRSNLN